jgi:hypothetical protein
MKFGEDVTALEVPTTDYTQGTDGAVCVGGMILCEHCHRLREHSNSRMAGQICMKFGMYVM